MSYDRERFLGLVAGDRELAAEVLRTCMETLPTHLGHVRQALESDDARATAEAAHRLVGSLLVICADPASECARRIEHAARRGAMGEAGALLGELESRLAELQAACAAGV